MGVTFLIVLLTISWFIHSLGIQKIRTIVTRDEIRSCTTKGYYGSYVMLWAIIPTLAIVLIWISSQKLFIDIFDQQTINLLGILLVSISVITGTWYALSHITNTFNPRISVERFIKIALIMCAGVAIVTMAAIVLSLLWQNYRFFEMVDFLDFALGTVWEPHAPLREDQVGTPGSYGAIPLFAGTALITLIAMSVAIPIGLLTAIWLSQSASPVARNVIKPMLEILAGIPTIVYGLIAALTVAPWIHETGTWLGFNVSTNNALSAGIVMGIMIIPFISSLSENIIYAVPRSYEDASLCLGATKTETMIKIILPAALPGIAGAVLLAVSRAIGETMIVVMANGTDAPLTFNPLEAVTTVTVQIASNLSGEPAFDSPMTLVVFALALTLFMVTLVLNVAAFTIVRRGSMT